MLGLAAWAQLSASAHRRLGDPMPLLRAAWALWPSRSPLGPASPDALATLSGNDALGIDGSDADDPVGRVPSEDPLGGRSGACSRACTSALTRLPCWRRLGSPSLLKGEGGLPKNLGRAKGRLYGAVMEWSWIHVKRACSPAVAIRGRSWIYY
jgi:hypothetical protein